MNTVKTLLYDIFDNDKTHDILFYDNISYIAHSALRLSLKDKGIFDISKQITLIDRYVGTINTEYEWADAWLERFYPFIKDLSRTGILNNDFITGYAYGKTESYHTGWGMEKPYNTTINLNLSDYVTETITITVPPDTEAYITWLQNAHNEEPYAYSSRIDSKVGTYLTVFMRKEKVLKNYTEEDIEIELNTLGWLHNSVVLPDVEGLTTDLTEKQEEFWLYDNIEKFTAYLWDELQFPNPLQALTSVTVESFTQLKSRLTIISIQTERDTSNVYERFDGYTPSLTPEIFKWSVYKNPVFTTIPDSYYKAYWWKAEDPNNESEVFNEKDERLVISIDENYLQLYLGYYPDYFQRYLHEEGFTIGIKPFPEKLNAKTINITRDTYNEDQFNLVTEDNNWTIEVWLGGFIGLYPIFINTAYYITHFLNDRVRSLWNDLEDREETTIDGTLANHPGTYTNSTSYINKKYAAGYGYGKGNYGHQALQRLYYGKTWYSHISTDADWLTDPVGQNQQSRTYYNFTGFIQYALSPHDDYHLFNTGQAAWIRNCPEIKWQQDYAVTFLKKYGSSGNERTWAEGDTTFEYQLNQDVLIQKFNINANDPPYFTVADYTEKDEIIPKLSWEYSGPFFRGPPIFTGTSSPYYLEYSTETTLTRTFRTQPLPALILED